MNDSYPSTDDHQWVRLDYAYPDAATDLNRWLPLVKFGVAIHVARVEVPAQEPEPATGPG